MHLFDTHCHLDVEAFNPDRAQVLTAARQVWVQRILVPAIRRSGWQALWAFCAGDAELYPAIGLHPVMLNEHREADIAALEQFVERHRPAAIGEIGLDYFVRELDHDRQQHFLEAQLGIAERHRLPVVLHVRKAHDPMLQTLARFDLPGGTCHAFNGSLQQAHRYLDMGFKLGFGGMLTYPKANKLRNLARQLPLQAIVLETDAPDMTGFAHHYQRNSPAYLPEVLQTLCELRNQKADVIADQTTANAIQVLRLEGSNFSH